MLRLKKLNLSAILHLKLSPVLPRYIETAAGKGAAIAQAPIDTGLSGLMH